MGKTHQSQRGASAVEFAIIAPLFISLLFAIVEFGLIIYTKGMLTHASREGARLGVVYATPRRTAADIRTRVQDYLNEVGLTSTADVVVMGAGGAAGAPLRVRVNYTYQFFVLPQNITTFLRMANLNLRAETVMVME